MNSRALVALLLCGLLATTESTIIVAAGTTAATAAAAGLAWLGLGALAVVKGALIGTAVARGKRDVSQEEQAQSIEVALDVAQQIDTAGCVAKLLCELEAMPADQLSPAMAALKAAFGNPESVNFHKLRTSRGVYDLAATFGAKVAKNDPKACDRLFESCPLPGDELFFMLETVLAC
ncbi:uncharacterized protein [Penaeus vannamei]|uniref:uncharacterized protein n=1 Tax=Penaeus vannamei TaxID=6689 RepID=UPI000F68F3E7|nr:uncharacterized protein LOC113810637 [Penaeus vannamei]